MRKYSSFWVLLLLLWSVPAESQYKPEREHRIKKSQFPEVAMAFMKEHVPNAHRKRYYQETDSSNISYRVKFRKEKLLYRALFDGEGQLQAIDFGITEVDVPEEAMQQMTVTLEKSFSDYHIQAFLQQYVLTDKESPGIFLKNTFQNLLLPDIQYVMLITAKQTRSTDYEIYFDARGFLTQQRVSLPFNFDHVLY